MIQIIFWCAVALGVVGTIAKEKYNSNKRYRRYSTTRQKTIRTIVLSLGLVGIVSSVVIGLLYFTTHKEFMLISSILCGANVLLYFRWLSNNMPVQR